jgi:hypothetical protein
MNQNIKKILNYLLAIILGTFTLLSLFYFFGFEGGVIGALGFLFTKVFLSDLEKN